MFDLVRKHLNFSVILWASYSDSVNSSILGVAIASKSADGGKKKSSPFVPPLQLKYSEYGFFFMFHGR